MPFSLSSFLPFFPSSFLPPFTKLLLKIHWYHKVWRTQRWIRFGPWSPGEEIQYGGNPFVKQTIMKWLSANNRIMYKEMSQHKGAMLTAPWCSGHWKSWRKYFLCFQEGATAWTKIPCQDLPADGGVYFEALKPYNLESQHGESFLLFCL